MDRNVIFEPNFDQKKIEKKNILNFHSNTLKMIHWMF